MSAYVFARGEGMYKILRLCVSDIVLLELKVYNTLCVWKTFIFLFQMRSRSKEAIAKLEDVLANMKPSEFKDNHLLAYKVRFVS